MSNESALREEICRVGASLFQRGYTVGTAAISAHGSTMAG
jgi:ribulose-5-phosphate 4-epimerase/fuculose-1-phosphate aldolase